MFLSSPLDYGIKFFNRRIPVSKNDFNLFMVMLMTACDIYRSTTKFDKLWSLHKIIITGKSLLTNCYMQCLDFFAKKNMKSTCERTILIITCTFLKAL